LAISWRGNAVRSVGGIDGKGLTASGTSQGRLDVAWRRAVAAGSRLLPKALYLQQEFAQEGQMIRNSLQTNGTLLDHEWCRFFKEYGFQIGLSVDGPVHDANRVYASGKGSFAEVERAIRLLQEYQIPFGVLMVLNHKSLRIDPEEIFNFFLDHEIKTFSFLAARPDNGPGTGELPTTDYVGPAEFAAFMKRIFDLWIELDDPSVKIRELTSFLSVLVGGSAGVCTLAGHCLGQYFHVEPNGDLYHCDKFLGDPDYQVGNILAHTFRDVRGSARMQRLVAEEKGRIAVLSACPWFGICNGGCPHDRYVARKYMPDDNGACCGLRPLIEHVCDRVKHNPLIQDRLGYGPMVALREATRAIGS
jgi:uncharacterized protein